MVRTEEEFAKERSDMEKRVESIWKESSKKDEEIRKVKKTNQDKGKELAEEDFEELRDNLKYVQPERVEATRQAEFLRNKVKSLESKLKEAENNLGFPIVPQVNEKQ